MPLLLPPTVWLPDATLLHFSLFIRRLFSFHYFISSISFFDIFHCWWCHFFRFHYWLSFISPFSFRYFDIIFIDYAIISCHYNSRLFRCACFISLMADAFFAGFDTPLLMPPRLPLSAISREPVCCCHFAFHAVFELRFSAATPPWCFLFIRHDTLLLFSLFLFIFFHCWRRQYFSLFSAISSPRYAIALLSFSLAFTPSIANISPAAATIFIFIFSLHSLFSLIFRWLRHFLRHYAITLSQQPYAAIFIFAYFQPPAILHWCRHFDYFIFTLSTSFIFDTFDFRCFSFFFFFDVSFSLISFADIADVRKKKKKKEKKKREKKKRKKSRWCIDTLAADGYGCRHFHFFTDYFRHFFIRHYAAALTPLLIFRASFHFADTPLISLFSFSSIFAIVFASHFAISRSPIISIDITLRCHAAMAIADAAMRRHAPALAMPAFACHFDYYIIAIFDGFRCLRFRLFHFIFADYRFSSS